MDLFSGSATVLSVAKNLNRKFIGIEVNKDIYSLGKERLINNELVKTINPLASDYQINFLRLQNK